MKSSSDFRFSIADFRLREPKHECNDSFLFLNSQSDNRKPVLSEVEVSKIENIVGGESDV